MVINNTGRHRQPARTTSDQTAPVLVAVDTAKMAPATPPKLATTKSANTKLAQTNPAQANPAQANLAQARLTGTESVQEAKIRLVIYRLRSYQSSQRRILNGGIKL